MIPLAFPRLRPALILIPTLAALLTGAAAPSRASSPSRIESAARGAYGLLWLDVDPSRADVALDGSHLDAGVWLISVAPGTHDISIRMPGYRTHYARFEVAPGQSVHLEVRLQPGADAGL